MDPGEAGGSYPDRPVIRMLLISGSSREGSTNSAVLRTAAGLAPANADARSYSGIGELPLFNPDDDREGTPVDEMVGADGLVHDDVAHRQIAASVAALVDHVRASVTRHD